MRKVSLRAAKQIVADWADYMDVDSTLFTVQVGDFRRDLPPEALECLEGDEIPYGATITSPDSGQFIIAISERCPQDLLEHTVVHELVHVWAFSQARDERHEREMLTDQLAQMIERLRDLEYAAQRRRSDAHKSQ